jgi:hypothetical protein
VFIVCVDDNFFDINELGWTQNKNYWANSKKNINKMVNASD